MSELEGQHEHAESNQGRRGRQGEQGIQGRTGETPTGDLLDAVRDLTTQVAILTKRLQEEYPKRDEVRHDGRKRALGTLAFGIVLILLSNFVTIATISFCFLSPTGAVHSQCNIMPGYEETTNSGRSRLARFELLIRQIEQNRQDIAELQEQLDARGGN